MCIRDRDYTIEKDGKSAAITDLAAYDVISVLSVPIAGADTIVTISVSNAKTSGTVEETVSYTHLENRRCGRSGSGRLYFRLVLV